jgi:DNA invertase Pin-like site-specific DNA recombinase
MVTDRVPPDSRLKIGPEGIDVASLQEIVDIDSASLKKLVTAIVGAQRTLRSECTRAGLATARQRGQKLGRPRALSDPQIALARRMMIKGATRKVIAQTLKVTLSTLYLALKPYAAEAPPRPKPPVPPRALTETQIALARRMLAAGVTRKIIATTLKVAPSTLSIALKPYGTGPHPQMGRRRETPCAFAENQADAAKQSDAGEAGTPSPAEPQGLIDAPPADKLKGVRDRAIMATLHYHDIRREELSRLRVKDLRTRRGILHLRITDKRGKIRFVPLNASAQGRIERYLKLAGHGSDRDGALFRPVKNSRGRLDRPIDHTSVSRNVVRKYRVATGITDDLHGLRTHASERDYGSEPARPVARALASAEKPNNAEPRE